MKKTWELVWNKTKNETFKLQKILANRMENETMDSFVFEHCFIFHFVQKLFKDYSKTFKTLTSFSLYPQHAHVVRWWFEYFYRCAKVVRLLARPFQAVDNLWPHKILHKNVTSKSRSETLPIKPFIFHRDNFSRVLWIPICRGADSNRLEKVLLIICLFEGEDEENVFNDFSFFTLYFFFFFVHNLSIHSLFDIGS